MSHRIKFLFLVLLVLLPIVLVGSACTLASDGQRPPSGYDMKNILGDALQIGDVLDAANEYGQNGGRR